MIKIQSKKIKFNQLRKIINNLKKNSNDLNSYSKQSTIKLRDNLYGSYDILMNEKYKIEINQNTLERVKNYFR